MNLTPERWQHVARIYELAVDHDADTRAAFLDEACADDQALRREVDSLLRQDMASVVLDRPLWATAAPLFDDGARLGCGAALGPYRIEGLLGAGGMGEVFRATDTRLGRSVAIKTLPTSIALDQQMRARFAREAKVVAALTHPHICTLYDIGRHDDIDFIVMEYLEGDTLAARLANGRLSLDEAVTHAMEIAAALDYAHRHGVVHRDLKPANILLTASGAKLLDFGLAKFRPAAPAGMHEADETLAGTIPAAAGARRPWPFEGDDAHVTRGGTILGTARYMAPEQLEGHQADARSDLFSFGAVVYEMVTGRRAFDGDSAASIRAGILEHEPPLVSSLQPLAPPAFDDIVRGCLAKDRDERWQTADDVLRALKPVSESSGQTRTRRREVWGRVAAILLAAITGLAGWLMVDVPQAGEGNAADVETAPGRQRVAVAVFENHTGDPELDPLGWLAAERAIGSIATLASVEVVSRPVDRPPGGSVAHDAGPLATLLVVGTYYLQRGELALQAQILDGERKRLLRSIGPITGSRASPAEALGLLEQKVAGAVAIHFDDVFGGLHAVSHPPTLDGYREFRAGVEVFESDYPRTLAHLERAVEGNPGFLQPLLIMYFVRGNLGHGEQASEILSRMEGQLDRLTPAERLLVEFVRAERENRLEQAVRVLQDLERLVPTSMVVNYNIGQYAVLLNRPGVAVAAFDRLPWSDRSLRHSIGRYRFHGVTYALHMLGEHERELDEVTKARQYAPAAQGLLVNEVRTLAALGRVADVTRVIDRGLSMVPDAGRPSATGEVMLVGAMELREHGYGEASLELAGRAVEWCRSRPSGVATSRAHRELLARALYLAERWDEAERTCRALASENPREPWYVGYLGQIAARKGNGAQARRLAEELERLGDGSARAVATYHRARIAALLGDPQRAVDLLRDALSEGLPFAPYLHAVPDFESLRDYMPYVELTRPRD